MTTKFTMRPYTIRTKRRKPSSSCQSMSGLKCLIRYMFPFMILVVVIEMIGVLVNYQSFLVLEQMHSPQTTIPERKPLLAHSREHFLEEDNPPPPRRRRVNDMWFKSRDAGYRGSSPVNATCGAVPLNGKEGNCVQAAEWQSRFYPVCNSFHELGFRLKTTQNKDDNKELDEAVSMEFLGAGKSRDGWKIEGDSHDAVLKTLQVGGSFTHLTYYHQIVDAIAAERLSASPYVIDIYGFCGASVLNELGVSHQVKEKFTLEQKIRYARDIAGAIADVHEIGGGFPKLVHGDLRRGNIMFNADRSVLKLHDFNLGFFLAWDTANDLPCSHKRDNAQRARQRDKFSSPEETFGQALTEKTDIYHLGGMLFYILTGGKPFIYNDNDDLDEQGNPKIKDQWTLPVLSKRMRDTKDPVVTTMWNAVQACMRYKAKNRPTARRIFKQLSEAID